MLHSGIFFIIRLSILGILASLSTSCGQSNRSSVKEIPISPNEVNFIIANQSFKCPTDGCPEGIGRLFSINFNNFSKSHVCTAFLVGPKTIMTNSHCIYFDGIDLEKTCEGVHVAFPGFWGYSYTSKCSKISWRDPAQNSDPYYKNGDRDFALIELENQIPLNPRRFADVEISEGEELFPVVVDHFNKYRSEIMTFTCKVNRRNKRDGIIELVDCPVIAGNSGSPLFNAKNEVTGIIFGSQNPGVRGPGDLDKEKTYKNVGFAYSIDYVLQELTQFFN